MKRLTILALPLFLLAGPVLAEDCRIPDPKPGQAIKVPASCTDSVRLRERNAQASKSETGAIDLGYGTKLRIGGRVRAETLWRR
jgi:hypothetical protein